MATLDRDTVLTLDRQSLQHLGFFNDLIIGTAREFSHPGDPDRYLDDHCYSFLLHPSPWQAPSGSPQINSDRVFHLFRGIYVTLASDLIGRTYNRKPYLQPLTIAFLDYPASRVSRECPQGVPPAIGNRWAYCSGLRPHT